MFCGFLQFSFGNSMQRGEEVENTQGTLIENVFKCFFTTVNLSKISYGDLKYQGPLSQRGKTAERRRRKAADPQRGRIAELP